MDIYCNHLMDCNGILEEKVQQLEQAFKAHKLTSELRALRRELYTKWLPTMESGGSSQVDQQDEGISLPLRKKLKLTITEETGRNINCQDLIEDNMWLQHEVLFLSIELHLRQCVLNDLDHIEGSSKTISDVMRKESSKPSQADQQNEGISFPLRKAEVKETSAATCNKLMEQKLTEEEWKRRYLIYWKLNRKLKKEALDIKLEYYDQGLDETLNTLEVDIYNKMLSINSHQDQNEGISLSLREAEENIDVTSKEMMELKPAKEDSVDEYFDEKWEDGQDLETRCGVLKRQNMSLQEQVKCLASTLKAFKKMSEFFARIKSGATIESLWEEDDID